MGRKTLMSGGGLIKFGSTGYDLIKQPTIIMRKKILNFHFHCICCDK